MSPRSGLEIQAVLRAAAQLADEHGLEAVTLAMLAHKLDIKSPSLYNHVSGLQGLRSKLAAYGVAKLHEALLQAATGVSGDEAVRAICRAYLHFARTQPGLYESTLRAPEPDNVELGDASSALLDTILRVLQSYSLGESDALHTVRCIRSALHGFASLERNGGFGMPLELGATEELLIHTLLAGIHSLQRRVE
ncbi:TetR/AcrR family transcriptional regulator [Paenibacillus sp. YYML68]|uniref:TetR/AcrR family transcriptional regulator n=1 Tax=Paenibacillus sp. YYML68 TaxID=2909250 RepID=UPI002492D411|nr:TetR/AcrR family transcriptional regulator [Paenibacillus sp. YYML68]